MTADELKRNIDTVTERVNKAAIASGHKVTLVAATKTVPADVMSIALDCGIAEMGENRVQEYIQKRDAVKPAKWHFIGTLQSNKAKYLVGNVALIQSVNSLSLAAVIDGLAEKRGIVQDVLVEVNAGGEKSKTGADMDSAEELIESARKLSHITVRGVMAIPPKDAEDGVYKTLYRLYEKYRDDTFDILSVGMSGDYEKAISFGSNLVRIGTAIFGQRLQKERQ